MGDIVEITEFPVDHPDSWYRVTGSALRFEVKVGRPGESVSISLATRPDPPRPAIEITIGHHNRTTSIKDIQTRHCNEQATPNILSAHEYRGFWLRWCNGLIMFGRDGEEQHIVLLKVETSYAAKLQYISFNLRRHSNPVHWRVELRPKLPSPSVRPVSGGRLCWQPADTQLPDGALIGGFEKESLYIIRMDHRRSLTPGKFVPSEGLGYIAWGGSAIPGGDFQVLCGFDGIWVPTGCNDRHPNTRLIPEGAFLGGHSEVGGEPLYVGRAYHNGHLIPGKIHPSHKVLYIPYEGKEIAKEKFEVLVDPNYVPRTEDRFIPLPALSSIDIDPDVDDRDRYTPTSPNDYYEEDYEEVQAF